MPETDFSKMEPAPDQVALSDIDWRPRTVHEQEVLYHWAYSPFFIFAECQACGHRNELDMAGIIEKKRCGNCNVAWLKARFACTNHNCRQVGRVALQFERKPMKPRDPNVTPLGGRPDPNPSHPMSHMTFRTVSEHRRRRGGNRRWYLKYLDENGNATHIRRD